MKSHYPQLVDSAHCFLVWMLRFSRKNDFDLDTIGPIRRKIYLEHEKIR